MLSSRTKCWKSRPKPSKWRRNTALIRLFYFEWNLKERVLKYDCSIFLFRMIKAILIFNNQGKPRMTKFYQRYSESEQQAMIEVRFGIDFCNWKKYLKFLGNIFTRITPRGRCMQLFGGRSIGKYFSFCWISIERRVKTSILIFT